LISLNVLVSEGILSKLLEFQTNSPYTPDLYSLVTRAEHHPLLVSGLAVDLLFSAQPNILAK